MVEDAAGVEDDSGKEMEVEGESKERGWEHGPGGAISVAIPLPPPALLSISLSTAILSLTLSLLRSSSCWTTLRFSSVCSDCCGRR